MNIFTEPFEAGEAGGGRRTRSRESDIFAGNDLTRRNLIPGNAGTWAWLAPRWRKDYDEACQEVAMQAVIRTFALALAALTMTAAPIESQAYPYGRGYGYYHGPYRWGYGGPFWGGVGIGLGLGIGTYYYGAPWYPGYVLTAPRPVYPVAATAPEPVAKAPPEPVIYPRNGQSPAQTETDRQACDRWAMSQPSAMADASVFHRATLACMEGRGYTVR